MLQGGRIEENPKTHYNEIERQATWSICHTHNMDSRQFSATMPRSVPLDQADRSRREPLDGCVTLGRGGQYH